VIADPSLDHFQAIAKTMNECLHAYGIHSATIQPEIASSGVQIEGVDTEASSRVVHRRSVREASGCEIHCGSMCEEKSCCG
jgi:zinc transporter 1